MSSFALYEKAAAKIESLADLQEAVFNITDGTVNEVCDAICASEWICDQSHATELMRTIMATAYTDSAKIPPVCTLLVTLKSREQEIANLHFIRDAFMQDDQHDQNYWYLWLLLFEAGYVNQDFLRSHAAKAGERCLHFYFAPELGYTQQMCVPLFNTVSFELKAAGRSFYPAHTLEEFAADDWKLHKQYRKNPHNDNEIAVMIRNDDVDSFQKIYTERGMSSSDLLPYCFYSPDDARFARTSVLDYAAKCGSLKCFKFMLMDEQALDESTLRCAIRGGNTEMVRILEERQVEFKSWMSVDACRWLHMELFEWIVKEKNMKFIFPTFFTPMRILEIVIKDEIELDETGDREELLTKWMTATFPWMQ